jgi:lysozyme
MSDRARGVDVSHYRPVLDWDALFGGGVSFVGIKATQGQTFVDPTFTGHRAGARAQPFELVFYYHFAAPGDAAGQAGRFLDTIGELRGNERLCLDLEDDKTGNPAVTLAWAETFYAALPTDRRHMLYTSNRIWLQLGNPEWPRAASLSLMDPRYGSNEPEVPRPWKDAGLTWDFWQFSQDFVATGIAEPCDASYFNGDLDALRAFAALPVPATT